MGKIASRCLAVLLGLAPAVAAYCSGGFDWMDRVVPVFFVGAVSLIAMTAAPGSCWELRGGERLAVALVLAVLLTFWCVDLLHIEAPLGRAEATTSDVRTQQASWRPLVVRRNAWEGSVHLIGGLTILMAAWTAQALVRHRGSNREWMAYGMVGGAAVYAGLRLAADLGGLRLHGVDATGFINRNAYAHYLGLNALIALALGVSTGRRPDLPGHRILMLALAGAFTLLVGLTTSRGAAISLLVVGGGFMLLALKRAPAALVFPVLGGVLAMVFAGAMFAPDVLRRFQGPNVGAGARIQIWLESIGVTGGAPWIGYGAGSFPAVFNRVTSLQVGGIFAHAESTFLTLAVEYGWIVFAGLFALLGWCAWTAWTNRRESWRGFCLAVPPVALFACHGFVETLGKMLVVTLTVALAVALARGKSAVEWGKNRGRSAGWRWLGAILAFLLCVAAWHAHATDGHLRAALQSLKQGQLQEAQAQTTAYVALSADEARQATILARRWTQYADRTGIQDRSVADTVLMITAEALRRQPAGWETWFYWGSARIESTATSRDALLALRDSTRWLPIWDRLYPMVVREIGQKAPALLPRFYLLLSPAERKVFWQRTAAYLQYGRLPVGFLRWAVGNADQPEYRLAFSKAMGQGDTESLQRIWNDPERPLGERLRAGAAMAKQMQAARWFEAIPPDLESHPGIAMLKLEVAVGSGNKELASRLVDEIQAKSPPTSQNDRLQFAHFQVQAGRAEDACRTLTAMASATDGAQRAASRAETVISQFGRAGSRAAADTLWAFANRNPSDVDVWMNLVGYLVASEDGDQGVLALKLFPDVDPASPASGEVLYYRARAAELKKDWPEAAKHYLALLEREPRK